MAVFEVVIQKRLGDEFWTNGYYVNTGTITEAADLGEIIVDAEKLIHADEVVFDKLIARTPTPVDNTFISRPLSGTGGYSPQSNLLPLWNVARLEWSAGFGRPYYKLYRGCLAEGDVSFDTLGAGTITRLLGFVSNTDGDLVTRTGIVLVDGTVRNRPFNRQLRRGKKKSTTPVI